MEGRRQTISHSEVLQGIKVGMQRRRMKNVHDAMWPPRGNHMDSGQKTLSLSKFPEALKLTCREDEWDTSWKAWKSAAIIDRRMETAVSLLSPHF